MTKEKQKKDEGYYSIFFPQAVSRRQFLKRTALGVPLSLGGPFFLFPERAKAQQKTLSILQWKHFAPGYDKWFDEVLAREWGDKNSTKVIIDHVPLEEINTRAAAEVMAREGHDLVMFPSPPARYEKHVIDHAEIHQEVAGKQGQVNRFGYVSSYNPKTKKFYAFADSYIPTTFNYRRDYWQQIGMSFGPTNYDSLRMGARQLREKLGVPSGIGLAPEPDSNVALHGLLLAFGGSVQDARGNVAINSKATIEALKYVKALYQESGAPELFNWNSASNDRALIEGKVSCIMNALSTSRLAEQENSELSQHIRVNPALRGEQWLSVAHITSCYVIWEFARNKEGAKQFLANLVMNLGTAFEASGFCNLPCFPKALPKLKLMVEDDPSAIPKHKYALMSDAAVWTAHVGYPGFANAAIDEVFNSFVIPGMFAAVAKGESSPEDSAAAAEGRIKRIFEKWKNA
ncbi:MAG: extracellular solute-binding protein [Blastocatellia bacterium]|nr:extracellular solute-binding protein [Blastocatellia bacterium]